MAQCWLKVCLAGGGGGGGEGSGMERSEAKWCPPHPARRFQQF